MSAIEKTKNYPAFVHADAQRNIKPQHVSRLKKSMKKIGFLESKPITVYLGEDGKFVVIDGHHRLEAAISLGIPVVYLIVKKSESNTMIEQNELMLKWSFTDYCTTWLQRGKTDYAKIISYAPLIPIRLAAAMLWGSPSLYGGSLGTAIKSGSFKVRETRVIDTLLSISETCQPDKKKIVLSRSFILAFSKCMAVAQFNPRQLADRIKENPLMLCKCSDESMMLDHIDALYNFRSKPKIPLAHLAREASEPTSKQAAE